MAGDHQTNLEHGETKPEADALEGARKSDQTPWRTGRYVMFEGELRWVGSVVSEIEHLRAKR